MSNKDNPYQNDQISNVASEFEKLLPEGGQKENLEQDNEEVAWIRIEVSEEESEGLEALDEDEEEEISEESEEDEIEAEEETTDLYAVTINGQEEQVYSKN